MGGFWFWSACVLLAACALLAWTIWSMRRQRAPKLQLATNEPLDQLVPSLAGLALGCAVPGNRVEVIENGAFFDVLEEAIAGARQTVHFETFLWKDGELGRRMAEALAARARAGLEVRVLLDAIGCKHMGDACERTLREAGCEVVFFHPRRFSYIGKLNDRTHRKIVVVDGCEAFVGGHCIVDTWLGDATRATEFADVSVRVRGPVVHQVQAAFAENWVGATGRLFVGCAVFPEQQAAGDVCMHVAATKPAGSASALKVLHYAVVCLARERLWIQNPYFLPEPEVIEALGQAVARGVDVRVLMPSTGGSDMPMVQYAGHRNFERLLERGVRLFEYPHTLLHQKVMTVDGTWCAVGSCNFDDRSFESNYEIMLGISDPATARRLDAIFRKYAAGSTEVQLSRWRQRGTWERLKERAFYALNEFL